MKRAILATTLALVLIPTLSFAKEQRPSDLVFVGKGNLRVTIDGVNHGSFTSKRVEVDGVAPGNHRVIVKSVNPKFLTTKKVFDGYYDVPAGVKLTLEIKQGRLDRIAMVELSKPTKKQADAAAAPVKSYSDNPSLLHIQSTKFMSLIMIDGQMHAVDEDNCQSPKSCDVYDVVPGPHDIEVRTGLTAKKVLYKGRVDIPGGAEVFAKAGPGTFEIYNTTERRYPQAVAVSSGGGSSSTTTTTVHSSTGGVPAGGVSANMTVTDPETGEVVSVHAGVSGMDASSSVTVTETTTTVTESHSGDYAEPTGFGSIELTSTDGESFTVFIDGKERGTCNCLDGQSIRVKRVEAGEHKLVIKDFMGDEVWSSGRVWIEPNFRLKLGVSESGVEAFNRADAWRPGY